MQHSSNGHERFNLETPDRWRAHPDCNERKFDKVQSSVRRQRIHGAGIEDVRSKLVRLHRMSTGFDGNGSTLQLKQSIGMAPMPVHYIPLERTAVDHYQSHKESPADLPTADEARAEMRALREERIAARPSSEAVMLDAELRFEELEAELLRVYQRTLQA